MVSAANPNELAEQNLDAGDLAFAEGRTIPLPADPEGEHIEGGTAVHFDEEGYIAPQDGEPGDEPLGISLGLADESDDLRLTDERGDDNYYSVHLHKLPVVIEAEDAGRGDYIQADGAGGWEVDDAGDYPVVKVTDEEANLVAIAFK